MLAVYLAGRYLRTRRAAWLALAAVTLTVAVPIIVLGVMQGFVDLTERQVRAAESDLVLEARGDGNPRDRELEERLAAHPGVSGVAPYVSNFAVLTPSSSGSRSDARSALGVNAEGVDWQAEQEIGRLQASWLHPAPVTDLKAAPLSAQERGSGFLTPQWRAHLAWEGLQLGLPFAAGPLPLAQVERPLPGLILGRELVYGRMGGYLPVGQPYRLIIPNGSGGTVGRVLGVVSDTVGTGVLTFDNMTVLLPLPWGQRLMGLHQDNAVNGLRIRLEPQASELAIGQQLRDLVPFTWAVRTWWQLASRNLLESLRAQQRVLLLVMIAIQLICIFIVYAVFSTLVAEKRHDIGVLLGLGAPPSQIAGTFLCAGTIACFVGGLLGWAGGWLILLILNPLSDALGMPLFPQDVLYTPEAPISFAIQWPLIFIGIISAVGYVATLLPAWRAARIDPIVTLRENG